MSGAQTYPGVRVRLRVRLEDFGIDPPPPEFFVGKKGMEAFGSGGSEPVAIGEYIRVIDVQPYDFQVERNSARKADTAKVSFPRSKLPIDPQIVRSIGVQIFAGVYSSREYGEANGPVGAQGLCVPDIVPQGRPFAGQSNELFRGFGDDYSMTLREGSAGVVEIAARDSTGFFMDAEIYENPLKGLPADMPLDQIITHMIAGDGLPEPLTKRGGLPGARGTVVVVETQRAMPTIAEIKPPSWYSANRRIKKGRARTAEKSKKITFWDMVTDLCVSAGLKAYMRAGKKPAFIPGLGYILPAAEIVICDAQTYYAGKATKGSPLFAWGRNLSELRATRKFGTSPMKTIEIRAFDRRTGKQLRGRYPPAAQKRTNRATPSGKGDREEITVYEISELSGPRAQEQIDAAARSFYDQLARGEFEIQLRTRAMAAIPGNEENELAPDMLYLLPGDPIQVITDPSRDEYGQITYEGKLAGMTKAEFIKTLTANGYDGPTAIAIAKAQYDPRVQRVFFTTTVAISWTAGASGGFDFTVMAINYLDARGAIDDPLGNNQ